MSTIEPSAIAPAVENLKRAVAQAVAAAAAEVGRATDALNKIKGEHAAALAAHREQLDALTAQQAREQAKRTKQIAARENDLANGERELQADRERVAVIERAAEERAAYLTARLQGTAA